MYHTRIAIFTGAVAVSSFAALGFAGTPVAAATTAGSQRNAVTRLITARSVTVHTETARVGPKVETILVNGSGLPLYYFRADTPTKSNVSAGLAALWPPVIAARPTATGVKGTVRSLKQAAGQQVSYNGHFLYTFIDDSSGHVTGQGVSNFFVVTPDIKANGGRTAVSSPAVAPPRGYGY